MYVEVKDLRAEGLTENDYPSNWIECRIALAQSLIETITGRFFEERAGLTFELNGNGRDTIGLPATPVSTSDITSIIIDDETLDAEYYKVIMPSFPDGRFNPKLFRVGGIWPKGKYNITVTGNFGFVEADKTPPLQIKELAKRIVIWGINPLGDAQSQKNGSIVEETLEDYSYKLDAAATRGAFGDVKIDNLIAMYRVKRMFIV